MSLFARLNLLAVILCFGLVVLGAFVRLSNAGLGCPDWPGCYGQITVPQASHDVHQAETNFPGRPVEAPKAWKEMAHRYLVFVVSVLIAVLVLWSLFVPSSGRVGLALSIVGVLVVQIVFGALTVTLKVNPLIVTTHLILGLTLLSLLWWMWLGTLQSASTSVAPKLVSGPQKEARSDRQAWISMQTQSIQPMAAPVERAPRALRPLAALGLLLLCLQIFLGGWTSTNYAALACPDFPTCQGSFAPRTELSRAFTLWHGHDIDYEYGILDVAARGTVQLVHRYGALVITIVLGGIAAFLLTRPRKRPWRLMGYALIGALVLQLGIGIGIVELQLPLWLADAHNAGAALLLLTVIALNFFAWRWPLPPRATRTSPPPR